MLAHAVREEQTHMRAKHTDSKVHRANYLSKIADVANTLFMAGHGQGTNA